MIPKTQQSRFLKTLVAFIAVTVGGRGVADEPNSPTKILWAGSSSIYFHNQPKAAAQWLTRGGTPTQSELVGRSGTGIHVYLRPDFRPEYGLAPGQRILEKIAEEKYDFVVLQVPAEFINGPEGEEHDRSIDVFCPAIRAAGGVPVLYEMGWGRGENAAVGRAKIFRAAVRNRVTHIAPCSTAWATVRRERPDLELHNPPDRTHPGTLGCYLNLCCFYAALTGERAEDPPRDIAIWPHLTEEEKAAARARAKEMEFDAYDAALAGWMRMRVASSVSKTIDAETAAYLQRVAWEEYAAMQRHLEEAMENDDER